MRIQAWPAAIIGFFCVVFCVNAGFLWVAASGYQGMLDQQPYNKGLKYDVELSELEAFNSTKWSFVLHPKPLSVELYDDSAASLDDAEITIRALRPDAYSKDLTVSLLKNTHGRYASNKDLENGSWLLEMTIVHKEKRYRINRSVLVNDETVTIIKGE